MLPPGPRTPAWWQTLRYITRPLPYSRSLAARYGDVIRARTLNGRGVMVSSPELARLVFGADPKTFETGPLVADLFGQSSLLATSGAQHRRQRRLLNPRFHGQRIRAFLETMQRVTREHLARFEEARATGAVLIMTDVTQSLALDLILETAFGESRALDRVASRRLLHELVRAIVPAIVAAPWLRREWFGPWRRFRLTRARFDAWVDSLIEERRSRETPGGDLLGMLLEARHEDGSSMDDAEIRDQLMTLLLAGHETTAVALAWAVYFLLREPAVLDKLRQELAALGPEPAAEAIARLPYLGAIGSESLRIEPIVTDVARQCREPLQLGRYTVPARELVFVNLAAILRDGRVFPEPERFRPERFLEKSFGAAEFVPFGGGQRRCLGAAFAEAELAIVLAAIADEWELELADQEPEHAVRRNITMGPARGVRVRVRGRRERAARAP